MLPEHPKRIRAYVIDGLIGRGVTGEVFLGRDPNLQRQVAIKWLRKDRDDGASDFTIEARALAAVDHPNIVRIYEYAIHEGRPFFAMEYVAGDDLSYWLERGPMHLSDAIQTLDQVASGLAALHRASITHGDIKPSNILVGPAFRVVVTDLGFAIAAGQAPRRRGTPPYMAPEVAQIGSSPEADVYALGIVGVELLTGSTERSALASEGPLARLLDEMLADDPRDRPTAEVIRERLAQLGDVAKGSAPTFLLVDDDADFRNFAREVLRDAFVGATFDECETGGEALAAIDRREHAIAIVDLEMPSMSGIEFTAAAKRRAAGKSLPILVVTGSGGAREWRTLSELGAAAFLVKPVDPPSLISTARRLVDDVRRQTLPPTD